MSDLLMGDSSTPPAKYPPYPVWAFYIGGDTPHVWTDAEYESIPCRWVLPIFTASNPGRDVQADARAIIGWLHAHGWRPGELVAVDTETSILPGYLEQLDALITAAGFRLVDYESKGPESANPITAGGRWIADWTGTPHLRPDSVATQFINDTALGEPWDESLILLGARLHELHPPVTRRIAMVDVSVLLPELTRGDTGSAVARLQGLLDAWLLPTDGTITVDGDFGPVTAEILAAFQAAHGIRPPRGLVDGDTWAKLLTI